MPSSGPNYPSAGADDSAVGTITWGGPTAIYASDDSRASALGPGSAGTYYSHWLVATGFGFSIPSGATIDGIVVEWEKLSNGDNGNGWIQDGGVRIVKGGVIGATDKSNTTNWRDVIGGGDIFHTHGGAADLWGETWTASDINNSNFGAAISSAHVQISEIRDARIDCARITVYYTPGASGSGLLIGTQLTKPLLVSGGLVR